MELAATAVEAAAACRQERPENAVARGEPPDAVAHLDDRAHILVPDHEAGLDHDASVVDVEIGAAESGRLYADDRVAHVANRRLGNFLQTHLARGLEGDGTHATNSMRRHPHGTDVSGGI